ncbi:MAG: hypothetical protein M1821_000171 [Bathelium mastoideum]|nr:MAG: hypothetical protein M1821_000171 [Bathelium mastoideum]KAI9687795.1 MAG: hypothetical protein M1822_001875 [Bathelium mastoideum]
MATQPPENYASESKTESKSSSLNLPKIHGSHSLDELVSHSRNMSSTSGTSVGEAENTLSDSTYEVVDARNLVSDDELDVQSESLPSCGGNTTDCDVSSIADTEECVDTSASVTSLPPTDYPTPAPSADDVHESDDDDIEDDDDDDEDDIVEESSATVHPLRASLIQFPEPTSYIEEGQDVGTALVKQQIGSFLRGQVSLELKDSVIAPEVPISLQMRLSEAPLRQNGTYSVMIVGDISTAKKNALVQKLASALATGQVPSYKSAAPVRLSVIPVSPFDMSQSCPDVTVIESTGAELLVQSCSKLNKLYNEKGRAYIIEAKINDEWVCLRDESSPMVRSRALSHFPNLAIFVHSTPEPSSKKQRHSDWVWDVEEVLFNQGVPGIHLTNEALWTFGPGPESLLQMTAELEEDAEAFSPVDVDTFLRLHNGQLGRHLSFLESVRQDSLQNTSVQNTLASIVDFASDKIMSMTWSPKQAIIVSGLAFAFFITLLIHPEILQATPPTQVDTVKQTSALNSSLVKLTNCTTAISAPPFNSLLSDMQPVEDTWDRAAHSRLSDAIANGTEKFEAFPFADHFVAIKAPTGFTRLKDAPRLFVNANRNAKHLEANISKLVLEHYAVILEQQQSYGRVNLTVFTTTKPLIQQSILVDLGSFWRNPSAISAAFEDGLARGQADVKTFGSSVLNATNRWLFKMTEDVRKAHEKFQPAVTNATKSGADAGVAAGAATWETIKFAQTNTAAELSRVIGILSNTCRPHQVLRASYQAFNACSVRARLALTKGRINSKNAIESTLSQIARVQEQVFALPNILHRIRPKLRTSPSQSTDAPDKGVPIGKMRANAVSLWNKVFGIKPTSKAVGASLSGERVRESQARARRHNRDISPNQGTVIHTKTVKQALQVRPKQDEVQKLAKHRKPSKGKVRPAD